VVQQPAGGHFIEGCIPYLQGGTKEGLVEAGWNHWDDNGEIFK